MRDNGSDSRTAASLAGSLAFGALVLCAPGSARANYSLASDWTGSVSYDNPAAQGPGTGGTAVFSIAGGVQIHYRFPSDGYSWCASCGGPTWTFSTVATGWPGTLHFNWNMYSYYWNEAGSYLDFLNATTGTVVHLNTVPGTPDGAIYGSAFINVAPGDVLKLVAHEKSIYDFSDVGGVVQLTNFTMPEPLSAALLAAAAIGVATLRRRPATACSARTA